MNDPRGTGLPHPAGGLLTRRVPPADRQVLDEYFDEYVLAADPSLLRQVAEPMAGLLPSSTEVLVGMELGGIALTVGLSSVTGIPAAFLRRRRKAYGTRRQVEGHPVVDRQTVMIDDVVRSGAQIGRAAAVLRGSAAAVSTAVCVLDRGLDGRSRLAETGIDLRCLLVATT